MSIVLVLLLLTTIDSNPNISIGINLVKFNTTFITGDDFGNELRIFENYFGINTNLSLTTFDIFCIRLEVCELRKYQYLGDIKFVKMSNLGLDIELIIPIVRKIAPLIYCGTKYGPFDYRFPCDTIFEIVNREFHFGFGVLLNFSKKINVIFESQLYSRNTWCSPILGIHIIQTWGVEKLNLGLRYRLVTL
ncbi:MAG: hypothetical protein ABIL46_06650 [candidate division WOR-3 bacterium]